MTKTDNKDVIKTPVRYSLGMLTDADRKIVCVLRPTTTAASYPNMEVELGEYIATCINEHQALTEQVERLKSERVTLLALISETSRFELDSGHAIYRGVIGYEIEHPDFSGPSQTLCRTPMGAFAAIQQAEEQR